MMMVGQEKKLHTFIYATGKLSALLISAAPLKDWSLPLYFKSTGHPSG
jgi:hypothetical protein